MKERLAHMQDYERRVESKHIVRALEEVIAAEEKDGIIAIFMPYLDEPNITPLIEALIERNQALCMPAIDRTKLRMCAVQTLEGIRRNPQTKVFEPHIKEWIDEEQITLAIIPGRGFTRTGDRLGRGNGGYDYWISAQRKRNPQTTMIGICFDCQLLHDIPMESHDEVVDRVISATTDTHWIQQNDE